MKDLGPEIKCSMCGLSIYPRVARYLWLGFGWRGRPALDRKIVSMVLCPACADVLLNDVRVIMVGFSSKGVGGRGAGTRQ
jgi:hypothetical protein